MRGKCEREASFPDGASSSSFPATVSFVKDRKWKGANGNGWRKKEKQMKRRNAKSD